MGIIIYKPHCSKCGAIIDQVTYRKITELGNFIDIEPSRCPRCREVFETIEIPIPEEKK